ncbi:MAG: Nramp family divalent metal transporter [Crocinitomicaceae bacterium]|nr:Nramp family divalent metal transporter [Crocinitomicaceae bacterium]
MKNLLKTLGPGILFASTAIGVSHLVQSTQAGANFGFTLLWAVLLANILKYPFFEFGSRYANATGTSIIEGYKKLGNIPLILYFLITLVSMFLVTAAVGYVTAGFFQNLFGIKSTVVAILLVFGSCIGFLILNNFKVLDRLIKVTGIVLLLSTLIAFVMVLFKGVQGNLDLWKIPKGSHTDYFAFILPLMGWMPTAVDLSTWNSLWTVAKIKETGYHPKLKETLFDFKFGYFASVLLSICFLTLGAFLMFGTPLVFTKSAGGFAAQVIDLYTSTFGSWATIIMTVSAFSIMFGTSLGVFDGYSRAMSEILRVSEISVFTSESSQKNIYRILLLIVGIGSFFLIYVFLDNPDGFKELVNLATRISFLVAPVVAVSNWVLVQKKYVPKEFVPGTLLQVISAIGVLFLSVFTIIYFIA